MRLNAGYFYRKINTVIKQKKYFYPKKNGKRTYRKTNSGN